MRLRHVFLALCIAGVLLPYSQFIPWVLEHGLNFSRLVSDLFANRIGGFFGLDVVMSAIGLCIFIRVEAQRIGMRGRWTVLKLQRR